MNADPETGTEPMMHETLWNLRYAFRTLRRSPVLSAAIVLTLALGIGANVAIFGVVNAALFRPLPFAEEGRIVRIQLSPADESVGLAPSADAFLFFRRNARSFSAVAGQLYTSLTMATDGGPERIAGIGVTDGWSEALGVAPALGRDFTAEEERQGRSSGVLLLSDGMWRDRFGADPAILGRTLRLDGEVFTVVGVMPPGLTYPYEAELWFPLDPERDVRGPWAFNIPARLAPGVDSAQLAADLGLVTEAAHREIPDRVEGLHYTATPLREEITHGEEGKVLALAAAVGFLLLIVCANVANLLVARSAARRRELAIHASLGADRWRQVRQLLTESLLLGLAGGALGLALAAAAAPLLEPLLPGDLAAEVVDGVPLDLRVVAFTLAASVLASLVFGALPALRLAGRDPKAALAVGRSGGADRSSLELGRLLVVGEIALSLSLLAGAGLMLHDFRRVHDLDLGYPAADLLTFRLSLDEERYDEPEERGRLWERVVEAAERSPGVRSAGVTSIFPSRDGNTLSGIELEGETLRPGERRMVNRRAVSPRLLQTMDLALVRGRFLEQSDRAEAVPVAVVSRSMAKRFWPAEDPIGRRFRLSNARGGDEAPWLTVVGVVADLREAYDEAEGTLYVPMDQSLRSADSLEATLVARLEPGTTTAAASIRDAVRDVDPALPLFHQATALELHSEALAQQESAATLTGLFAGLGLLVAVVGVYAAMAHAVARRRTEIGVRVALGSDRGRILGRIFGDGARLVALGGLLGTVGAWGLSRYLASVLTEVHGFEPAVFGTTLVLLCGAALAACLIPAWRATRIDPVTALKGD